jgi:hypothetical protein
MCPARLADLRRRTGEPAQRFDGTLADKAHQVRGIARTAWC